MMGFYFHDSSFGLVLCFCMSDELVEQFPSFFGALIVEHSAARDGHVLHENPADLAARQCVHDGHV